MWWDENHLQIIHLFSYKKFLMERDFLIDDYVIWPNEMVCLQLPTLSRKGIRRLIQLDGTWHKRRWHDLGTLAASLNIKIFRIASTLLLFVTCDRISRSRCRNGAVVEVHGQSDVFLICDDVAARTSRKQGSYGNYCYQASELLRECCQWVLLVEAAASKGKGCCQFLVGLIRHWIGDGSWIVWVETFHHADRDWSTASKLIVALSVSPTTQLTVPSDIRPLELFLSE